MMKVLFIYIDINSSTDFCTGLGVASISGYIKKFSRATELVYYRDENDYLYTEDKILNFNSHKLL